VPATSSRVEALLDQLESHYATLPGYLVGFRYRPAGSSGEVGRIGVWRSHEDADRAAQDSHVQALRSELNMLVPGEHVERVLEIEGAPQNLPTH
jgi:quinol monooxygenase YgiN